MLDFFMVGRARFIDSFDHVGFAADHFSTELFDLQ